MSPEKAFGETIRLLRLAKKMSQEELAFSSELDRSYVSQLECGLRSATIATIFKLAAALDVQVAEIMTLTEEKIKHT